MEIDMHTQHDEKTLTPIEDGFRVFCENQLKLYQRQLQDFEAVRRKVHTFVDGSWIETTIEEKARLRALIAELTEFLSMMD
jgi:hypothetical protein